VIYPPKLDFRNIERRPSVIVIAVLYIAVGSGGFVTHFPSHWGGEDVLIEATELLAVICGVFLLFPKNWSRWLAVAWMALHVVISFPAITQVTIHLAFLIVISWVLFRSPTRDASV
jgi:hypothetical protein